MRYSVASLYPDYLRTAFGLAVTLGPLLWLDLAGAVAALLAGLGLLFAWFGTRTVVRHLSQVELSGDAISLSGPVPRRLAWSDLERLKLAYYAPRRSRDDGWLQLTLERAGWPSDSPGLDALRVRSGTGAGQPGGTGKGTAPGFGHPCQSRRARAGRVWRGPRCPEL